jgi:glucose/arabinose dehydrogenase
MMRPASRSAFASINACLLGFASALASWSAANAQTPDLLGDSIPFSGATLMLRPYATLPSGTKAIIAMTYQPGDSRLYVTTEQGIIYAIDDDGAGDTTPVTWFNVAAALTEANGVLTPGFGQQGLQSTAFHPDFANPASPGYGKLYTTSLQNLPTSDSGRVFLGDTQRGGAVTADSVLAEWTFNHAMGLVDASSYRELFRIKLPTYDHMIKQAQFNPYAQSGDADYGLLYLTHGDSSPFDSSADLPQLLGNALGKILRVNPLPAGSHAYGIPHSNPFVANGPGTLPEIYAYGFRNPHTYSFNRDSQGAVRILVGDIGRNNIEEVNLVSAGGNFGWTEREGTFVHLQNVDGDANSGYYTGINQLSAGESDVVDAYGQRYTYPVAQYDHNSPGVTLNSLATGTAIASGFVIQNSSDPALYNQLVFNDFATQSGHVYQVDFNATLAAVTQLHPNDPSRDQPSELTQAAVRRLHLALDHDNNSTTAPLLFDDLNSLVNAPRNDVRYGEGLHGEMYLSSKRNGVIYLVMNSLPLPGDYGKNGLVDGADLATWRASFGASDVRLPGDGNNNGFVDGGDLLIWQRTLGSSGMGLPADPFASKTPEPSARSLASMLLLTVWILQQAPTTPWSWTVAGRRGSKSRNECCGGVVFGVLVEASTPRMIKCNAFSYAS